MPPAENKISYPEWTELNATKGLDPLGMQTSSIKAYQDLVFGISNVTLRVRYYGLYAWLSKVYASKVGSTDPKVWQKYVRRAEALYALIAAYKDQETGISGITRARVVFNGSKAEEIDFAVDADPGGETPYLKQPWGAFGAAYGSQLHSIDIFARSSEHQIPLPSAEYGDELADKFGKSEGSCIETFFNAIERGKTTRQELESLQPMLPSTITVDGDERECYEQILFAAKGEDRPNHIRRKQTLLLILELARQLGRKPTVDDVRWALYSGFSSQQIKFELSNPDLIQHKFRWWTYQVNDLSHFAFETLLRFTLDLLEPYKTGITLAQLVSLVTEEIINAADESPQDWESFVRDVETVTNPSDKNNSNSEISIVRRIRRAVKQTATSCPASVAWEAVHLLAILNRRSQIQKATTSTFIDELADDPFRSFRTEMKFLDRNARLPFHKLIGSLIDERIVRRHFWVAIKKLRYQKDYTFLIEADEGKLRLRRKDGPVFTNPRLSTSINFLQDIHLISKDGVTKDGARILGAS